MYFLGGLDSDFKPISTILAIKPKQYNLEEVKQYHYSFLNLVLRKII